MRKVEERAATVQSDVTRVGNSSDFDDDLREETVKAMSESNQETLVLD